jgi:predicted membrane protein
MPSARLSDRSVIGLLLVALGIMFLLDTTDALGPGVNVVGTYWPALLIAWGVFGFIASRFVLRLWFVIVLIVGIVFLLSNLNLWTWNAGQLWPVILVVVGLALLFGGRAVRRGGRRWWRRRVGGSPERRGRGGWGPRQVIDASGSRRHTGFSGEFRSSHVFGGGREQVTSQGFQGGEVSAIFGGMELDLRGAGLGGGIAVIDATVICGGIDVRVPKDWRVNIQTTALFGGTENKRSQPSPEDARGELTITGTVLCGGIEVKD